MDATDNETAMQGMIDAQYALLTAEQTIFSDLQAEKVALIAGDGNEVASKSLGGVAGSESFAYLTLTQQMQESAARLKELTDELLRLCELKNKRFPWISSEQRRSLIREY